MLHGAVLGCGSTGPRLYERMNTMPLGLRAALTPLDVGFPVVRYNVGNVLGRTLCQWYKPQTAGLALGCKVCSKHRDSNGGCLVCLVISPGM